MSQEGPDAAEIKELGWRQGSVLPAELVHGLRDARLLPEQNQGGEFWVVVSHSCDVVSISFDAEPNVEIIRVSKLNPEQSNGARAWFRNPRVCDFHEAIGGVAGEWQISIRDRVTIPRRALLGHRPSTKEVLQSETIRRMASWIARRYTRAAFPNEFNRRCRPAQNRLREKLKSKGHLLTAIFLVVQDEELGADSPYEVVIFGCMRDDMFRDPQTRTAALELVDAVEVAFQACSGIEVQESALRSESGISLDDLRILKRWDWDYLSLRNESVEGLPPSDLV